MKKEKQVKAGYVDGFVFVVKKSKVPAYRAMAKKAGAVWMKHGALEYIECQGDDLMPDNGGMKVTRFPDMAKAKKGETVWFSFITYKNKAHRNQVNGKVMKDPFMNDPKMKDKPMPFDMARMAFGGFKVEVNS